ncbi:Protein kinase domain-containing protein [Psidium guajava]|nr:Protein kinase domain-containing protein [Psidium guajava]
MRATESLLAFYRSRALLILLAIALLKLRTNGLAPAFSLREASAYNLQLAFEQSKLTSRQLDLGRENFGLVPGTRFLEEQKNGAMEEGGSPKSGLKSHTREEVPRLFREVTQPAN